MKRYRLEKTLQPLPEKEQFSKQDCRLELMTTAECRQLYPALWENPNFIRTVEHGQCCKADLFHDFAAGTMLVPKKGDTAFGFLLRPGLLLLVDDTGTVEALLERLLLLPLRLQSSAPCLLFELLELLLREDAVLLEEYDKQLNHLEDCLLEGDADQFENRLHSHRKHLLKRKLYYMQLGELADCLSDEGSALFSSEECRLFELLSARVSRLYEQTRALREYTLQLHEIYQAKIDVRQNRIMQILTVLTAIFMPLTLVAGWYGMNFSVMPELQLAWAYPALLGGCAVLVVLEILWFRKKGWFK